MGEKSQRLLFYGLLIIALLAAIPFSQRLYADEDPVYQINLPAQSVAESLTSLSETLDMLLLFPYKTASELQANPVNGKYTLQQALDIMLDGTGFSGGLSKKGVLMISLEKSGKTNDNRETAGEETMKPKKSLLAATIAYLLSGGVGPQALAESDETAAQASKEVKVINEIIVTATRREMNLQDVPMSINAFSGEQLEQSGINDVQDLQFLASGMHVSDSNGNFRVTLRGVGSDQDAIGGESGVAMHRDGVYIARRNEVGMDFFDVERVEVLRGPQGTLYGRNSTGGAVNIISKMPTPEFEAGGNIGFGNYDLIQTEGYVSGPIMGDDLMGRLAFKTRDHNGYTKNIFNGDGLDNADSAAVRTILRYDFSGDARLFLSGYYARDDGQPVLVPARGRSNAPVLEETLGFVLPSGRDVNEDDHLINDKRAWGLSGKLEWELGEVTLSSLTAYRNFDLLMTFTTDGPIFTDRVDRLQSTRDQISQEFTLASTGNDDIEWIVGAYYFHESTSEFGHFLAPGLVAIIDTDDYSTDAYALFGEVYYNVFDHLTLTLGARYSYEEKSIDGGLRIPAFAADFDAEFEDDWDDFTPKVTLTYDLNDNFIAYTTVSTGFKAGGYNDAGSNRNGQGAFGPEEVTSYEMGLKADLLDNRLRTNIAVFYMEYKDMQQRVIVPNPVTGNIQTVILNASSADISGVELDLQAQPTEHLSVDGNLSYLDATFSEWPNAPDNTQGNAPTDVSGNQLPNAPEWAANMGVNYRIPLGDWTMILRGEYAYKSRVHFSPFEDKFRSQEAYDLFNARLTFEDATGKWSISGWMKNISDEQILSLRNDLGNRSTANYLPPRTYGITVGYRM